MFIAILTLVLFIEVGHGITRIVRELVGVADIKRLAVTEVLLQIIFTVSEKAVPLHTQYTTTEYTRKYDRKRENACRADLRCKL